MISQGPQDRAWVKEQLGEIRAKLFTTERNRDELATKLKSLQMAKTRTEAKYVIATSTPFKIIIKVNASIMLVLFRLANERLAHEELQEEVRTLRAENMADIEMLRKDIDSSRGGGCMKTSYCILLYRALQVTPT